MLDVSPMTLEVEKIARVMEDLVEICFRAVLEM
jgi:hypothetical protein